jgi:hypothetical protein
VADFRRGSRVGEPHEYGAASRYSSDLPQNGKVTTQLVVLAGVIVGALASYLTTAATERARWKRTLDSRWDDRRVEAYAAYGQAVREIIRIASRLAAGQGITSTHRPLAPTRKNLDLLEEADAIRAGAWERVLLLGNPETVAAARTWHESAWRLEWFVRDDRQTDPDSWKTVRSAANDARSAFYESARADLRVAGGRLPDADAYEARARRVRGDSLPESLP